MKKQRKMSASHYMKARDELIAKGYLVGHPRFNPKTGKTDIAWTLTAAGITHVERELLGIDKAKP